MYRNLRVNGQANHIEYHSTTRGSTKRRKKRDVQFASLKDKQMENWN